MRIYDLIRDPGTGQLSHTKLWTNIAYCAATLAFVRMAWVGTLTADMWLWYLGVVGAHNTLSKLISLRYGANSNAGFDPNYRYGGNANGGVDSTLV